MDKKLALLFILISFFAGCSSDKKLVENSDNNLAGEWYADTEYGDFSIYVNGDGSAITELLYDSDCKGVHESVKFMAFREHPVEIIKERKLSMKLSGLKVEAIFSSDGKRMTGTVTFMPDGERGSCKTDFTIDRNWAR